MPDSFALLALLARCANVRFSSRPGGNDLSGIDVFHEIGQQVGLPGPLVDFAMVKAPSELAIRQDGDLLHVSYITPSGQPATGTLDPAHLPTDVSWGEGSLLTRGTEPINGVSHLPGLARQDRGARLFRAEDGSPQAVAFFEGWGPVLSVIPVRDHHDDDELTLEPSTEWPCSM